MTVVRLFYGFQFFFSLLLWHPVFYAYHKQMGLNDPQIFNIQSIYYLAFCLFEFPTGFLADRWSYRKCMISGGVVLTVGNLLPVLAPSYAGFLWHWLLVALSRSLISGAASAYLYNTMLSHGEPEGYKRIEGLARAYSLLGRVLGWAGIGYLMEWHYHLPYTLTAAASFVSILFALRLPEIGTHGPRESLSPMVVVRMLLTSPHLMLVMVQGIGIFVLTRIVQVNLFQPILEAKGFGVGALGLIMAINTLFEAWGSAYPEWMRKFSTDLNAVFLLTAAMALSMALTAGAGWIGALIWLNVFALAAGLAYPIQRQVINDAIPDSRYRASFLSAESLLDRAVCAIVAAQLGAWVGAGKTDEFLYRSSGAAGLGIAALVLAFALLARRKRRT